MWTEYWGNSEQKENLTGNRRDALLVKIPVWPVSWVKCTYCSSPFLFFTRGCSETPHTEIRVFLPCFPTAVPVFLCTAPAFQLYLNYSYPLSLHSHSNSSSPLELQVASQHIAELWYFLAWLNGSPCGWEVSRDSPVIQEGPSPWRKNRLDFRGCS